VTVQPESPPHPNPLPHEDVVEREFESRCPKIFGMEPRVRITRANGYILLFAAFLDCRAAEACFNVGGFLDTLGVSKATMLLELEI
jgi:hypothetical protein